MRALLDVNVLIALLDAGHVHHAAATDWLGAHINQGWASCPLTQNGCLRILSTDSYAHRQPVAAVAARLREATRTSFHAFWSDEVSVLDEALFEQQRFLGSRQITDAYLLSLAVRKGGRLVSLDQGIDLGVVRGAEARHLVLI
jgi:toxin-antitoxin system PIN domain toxin